MVHRRNPVCIRMKFLILGDALTSAETFIVFGEEAIDLESHDTYFLFIQVASPGVYRFEG